MHLKKHFYCVWFSGGRRKQTDPVCSFCSASRPKLIAGPIGTNICSKCLNVCVEIISHNARETGKERISGSGGHALRCSFCSKNQDEVKQLIAGPTVYICNECVSNYLSTL